MKKVKIALGQMRAVQGDTAANLKKMEEMTAQAASQGAEIICFPELSVTGYFVRKEELERIAEPEGGSITKAVQAMAGRYGIWVIAGFAEREKDTVYNTCLLADKSGKAAGKARKVYLWKSEKKRFSAGSGFPVFDTEFARIAVLNCYDLEFPEPARIAALKGAELIFCPAAWSVPALPRWNLDLTANSLFNLLYTAGANYSDELCCGCSGVAGPDGQMMAQVSGQEEAVLVAELDPLKLEAMRAEVPYYEDMSLSVFSELSQAMEAYLEKKNNR